MATVDTDPVNHSSGIRRPGSRQQNERGDEHAGLESRPSIALEESREVATSAATRRGLVARSRNDCR